MAITLSLNNVLVSAPHKAVVLMSRRCFSSAAPVGCPRPLEEKQKTQQHINKGPNPKIQTTGLAALSQAVPYFDFLCLSCQLKGRGPQRWHLFLLDLVLPAQTLPYRPPPHSPVCSDIRLFFFFFSRQKNQNIIYLKVLMKLSKQMLNFCFGRSNLRDKVSKDEYNPFLRCINKVFLFCRNCFESSDLKGWRFFTATEDWDSCKNVQKGSNLYSAL